MVEFLDEDDVVVEAPRAADVDPFVYDAARVEGMIAALFGDGPAVHQRMRLAAQARQMLTDLGRPEDEGDPWFARLLPIVAAHHAPPPPAPGGEPGEGLLADAQAGDGRGLGSGELHDEAERALWASALPLTADGGDGDAPPPGGGGILHMGDAPVGSSTDAVLAVGLSRDGGRHTTVRLLGPQEVTSWDGEEERVTTRRMYDGDRRLPITGFLSGPGDPHGNRVLAPSPGGDGDDLGVSGAAFPTLDLSAYVADLRRLRPRDAVHVRASGLDMGVGGNKAGTVVSNTGAELRVALDGDTVPLVFDLQGDARTVLRRGIFIFPAPGLGGSEPRFPRGERVRATRGSSPDEDRGEDRGEGGVRDSLTPAAFLSLARDCAPTVLERLEAAAAATGVRVTSLRQAADVTRTPRPELSLRHPDAADSLAQVISTNVAAARADRSRREAAAAAAASPDGTAAAPMVPLFEAGAWDEDAYGPAPTGRADGDEAALGQQRVLSLLKGTADGGRLSLLLELLDREWPRLAARALAASAPGARGETKGGKAVTSGREGRDARDGEDRGDGGDGGDEGDEGERRRLAEKGCSRGVAARRALTLTQAVGASSRAAAPGGARAAEFAASQLAALLFSTADLGAYGEVAVVDRLARSQEGEACVSQLRRERRAALEREEEEVRGGVPSQDGLRAARAALERDVTALRAALAAGGGRSGDAAVVWPQFRLPRLRPSEARRVEAKAAAAAALEEVPWHEFTDMPHYRPLPLPSGEEEGPQGVALFLSLPHESERFRTELGDGGGDGEPLPVGAAVFLLHFLRSALPPSLSPQADRLERGIRAAAEGEGEGGGRARGSDAMAEVGRRLVAMVELEEPPEDVAQEIARSTRALRDRRADLELRFKNAARDFEGFRDKMRARIRAQAWSQHHRRTATQAAVLVRALLLVTGPEAETQADAGRLDERLAGALQEAQEALGAPQEALPATLAALREQAALLAGDGRRGRALESARRLAHGGAEGTSSALRGGLSKAWPGFLPALPAAASPPDPLDEDGVEEAVDAAAGAATERRAVDAVDAEERGIVARIAAAVDREPPLATAQDRRPPKVNSCCLVPVTPTLRMGDDEFDTPGAETRALLDSDVPARVPQRGRDAAGRGGEDEPEIAPVRRLSFPEEEVRAIESPPAAAGATETEGAGDDGAVLAVALRAFAASNAGFGGDGALWESAARRAEAAPGADGEALDALVTRTQDVWSSSVLPSLGAVDPAARREAQAAWEGAMDLSVQLDEQALRSTRAALAAFLTGTLRPALQCLSSPPPAPPDGAATRRAGAGGHLCGAAATDLSRAIVQLRRVASEAGRAGAALALNERTAGLAGLERLDGRRHDYAVSAMLGYSIAAAFDALLRATAPTSDGGGGGERDALTRLLGAACASLTARRWFAAASDEEIRSKVSEQLDIMRRRERAIREDITPEKREYYRELAQFKRVTVEDIVGEDGGRADEGDEAIRVDDPDAHDVALFALDHADRSQMGLGDEEDAMLRGDEDNGELEDEHDYS